MLTLRRAIERALGLDRNECAFQKACILEGELVVYNDLVCACQTLHLGSYLTGWQEHIIMPFHKIRGHVARRGRFMNTEQDSQLAVHGYLTVWPMLIFFLGQNHMSI